MTIETILAALSQLEREISFGIIVNQISKVLMEKLTNDNKDDFNELLGRLNTDSSSSHHKSFIHLYSRKEELDEIENAVYQIIAELLHFDSIALCED